MSSLPFSLGPTELAAPHIKAVVEDFRVDELPAYLPNGTGEHLFIRFEKRDANTSFAIKLLAQHLGVDPREVGTAGLKDRHGITTQWASFPVRDESLLQTFSHPLIRVLESGRHGNKLRTGHLRGNAFHIRVRNVGQKNQALLEERWAQLINNGVPNYYGSQRFGKDDGNAHRGRALLRGELRERDARLRRLFVSSLQSELFNAVCAERVKLGTAFRLMEGDVARKEESRGVFSVEDLATEQVRAERFEVSPTGPMFGPAMKMPSAEVRALEERILSEADLAMADFERAGKLAEGTRRTLRLRLTQTQLSFEDEDLVLEFALEPGAYATVVVRELFGQEAVESNLAPAHRE